MITFKSKEKNRSDFTLVKNDILADLFVEEGDFWGVKRATEDLKNDLNRVTLRAPKIKDDKNNLSKQTIFIGTIGKSKIIDSLNKEGKLDLDNVINKWESFTIQVINNPLPNVEKGLVIAGSDKRGTIFGIYELSQQIGVSPWYWWADVAVERQRNIYVKAGTYKYGEPSVKYRGLFLNDEAPSLTTWVEKKYGSFNHHFYVRVFELLLRLKANYLWPAMWKPRVFNEEDKLNPKMADKYGIVMGTSHHEPMMRSWEEWGKVGKGDWNYISNNKNIYQFWQAGLKRVKDYEGIVTVGMRGDGDEAMVEDESSKEGRPILEKIINDQREIIAELVDDDVSNVPQLLALYKEVQGFYEKGLKIPEDITLLLADDNFANIRMLPTKEKRHRVGGYGMYYHFDYVGGPRSYQWINTVPLQKIWEQMQMTYHYGVERIWIVNVGDLKPMELPIDFFLEMAWAIDKWGHGDINKYACDWARKQFGDKYAEEISEILLKYTKYNGRRKPELVDEKTYSLINYCEAERVLADYDNIVEKAEKIYNDLSMEKNDAFYQLVLYPCRASRNVLKMHIFAAKNKFYYEQGRIVANDFDDLTEAVYENEAADTEYYNKEMSNGKWDGMMLQPHIGKSNWRGPTKNIMPDVQRINISTSSAEMGVYLEGDHQALRDEDKTASLANFSVYENDKFYFEIFNKGKEAFQFNITVKDSWINLSKLKGSIDKQERIWISIDWDAVPKGKDIKSEMTIMGTGKEFIVGLSVFNPVQPEISGLEEMTFVESNGYISIEAEHYYKKESFNGVSWEKIDDYGRTLSSLFVSPSTAESVVEATQGPFLEYKVYLFTTGKVKATVYTAPSLNINRDHGLRYAISFDDKEVEIVDTFPKEYDGHHSCPYWCESVMENVHKTKSIHHIDKTGFHTLKIRMIDPGFVIQKIVLDLGGLKDSYLGPPESFYKK